MIATVIQVDKKKRIIYAKKFKNSLTCVFVVA